MAFEVMICHNSRPDCAFESVKISSDLDDSNPYFEVCYAYMWRHCDMICGENPFFTLAKNLVVLIQKAAKHKLNTLEITFLHNKCQLWPSLCESNWKKWTFFWWEQLWNLKCKCTFNCLTKRLKMEEQVSLGVIQHPTKFKLKILRGKN